MSYRKILEVPFSERERKTKLVPWVEDKIKKLECDLAKNFRDRKIPTLGGKSLADWLYDNCRHPLSHAATNAQVRDPSDYNDIEDVRWANTVMSELAKKIITEVLLVDYSKNGGRNWD